MAPAPGGCDAGGGSRTGPISSGSESGKGREELAAYAVGLDPTNQTGSPPRMRLRRSSLLRSTSTNHPIALGTKPVGPGFFAIPVAFLMPLFTGATSGSVRLYQINFIVPPTPSGLAVCADVGTSSPFTIVVQS